MVIVNPNGTPYYLDGYLKGNLDLAKKEIKNDWDMVFLIDGVEGSGKSVLALQCAAYCDPTFNIDRVCFSGDEFKRVVLNAEKYQAIVFDEAYGDANSRSTMSKSNKTIVKMLTEIRQKNLFIFVLLPSLFELDKYIAIYRSRALIHIYAPKFKRGQFMFYSARKKQQLYILGKKYLSYSKPKADFIGSCTNQYPIPEEEYRKKKAQKLIDTNDDEKEEQLSPLADKMRERYQRLLYYLNKEQGMPQKQIAQVINMHNPDLITVEAVKKAVGAYNKKLYNAKG